MARRLLALLQEADGPVGGFTTAELRSALGDPGPGGVVVVDELGKMELASAPFGEAVMQLLERDVAVVATLHLARYQLTDALRRRPDLRLVGVTEATRDALPERLTEPLVGATRGKAP